MNYSKTMKTVAECAIKYPIVIHVRTGAANDAVAAQNVEHPPKKIYVFYEGFMEGMRTDWFASFPAQDYWIAMAMFHDMIRGNYMPYANRCTMDKVDGNNDHLKVNLWAGQRLVGEWHMEAIDAQEFSNVWERMTKANDNAIPGCW